MINGDKKTKILFITFLLVASSFTLVSNNENTIVSASSNYTDFEIVPNSGHFSNLSTITLGIYVTPRTGYMVDTLSIDFINFSQNKLQCNGVTKGNIINGTGFEIWVPGTIDNDGGQITDILWGRQGSKASNPGYMCNITFDVIACGEAFINISGVLSIYNETEVASTVKGNSHIFFNKIILENPYPPNNGTEYGQSEVLHIDVKELRGQPIDLFWYSNVSGEWKYLGYNISIPNGTYYESCYGVVDSPYDKEISFPLINKINQTFYNSTCAGKKIGVIKKVEIYIPSGGTVQPVFEGSSELIGSWYNITNGTADITNDLRAPYEWTWDAVKNLDLNTAAGAGFINVTYDMTFGENTLIYWSVNATDGLSWHNETYKYTTISLSPTISNPIPMDGKTIIFLQPTLSVNVTNPNGNTMNVSFFINGTNESWNQIGTTQTGNNNTYSQLASEIYEYDTTYLWRVSVDGDNGVIVNRTFRVYTRPAQLAPFNFSASTINSTSMQLNWQKDSYSNYVMIKRRTDRPPVITDPGVTYNGTELSFTDNTTSPGVFYYYGGWTGNATDGTWSLTASYTQNISRPLGPLNLIATTIDYDVINLTWEKGQGANKTIIVRKMGSYPTNISDGLIIYNDTGANYSDTYSMGGNISNYYNAWAYSSYTYGSNYSQVSDENTTAMNTTFIGPPSIQTNDPTSITDTTATLNAYLISNGGEPATCGFYWGNDTYSENVTIGIKTIGESYSYNVSGLLVGSTYYVQAWAISIYALKTGENKTWYTRPSQPTNFNVTTYDDVSQNLSWTTGQNGVDQTVVVGKKGSYPTSPSDGLILHNSNGENLDVRYNFSMPTVQVSYDTRNYPGTGGFDIYGNIVESQSITTSTYFYPKTIRLLVWRAGYPGTVTVSIRKALNDIPIGEDLMVRSFNGNDLDVNTTGTYVFIDVSDHLLFQPGGTYAIVVKAQDGNSGNKLYWAADLPHNRWNYPSYDGGQETSSVDGGLTWSYTNGSCYYSTYDLLFEITGNQLRGLESNVTYYYRAWSYNTTSGLYSYTNASNQNTTLAGVPVVETTYPTYINDTEMTLSSSVIFSHGENSTCGFRYGSTIGVYPNNDTATGTYWDGQTVNKTITWSPGSTVYYVSWIRNSAGYYEDIYESAVTRPVKPTSFTASHYGARQTNLTWTKASGQDGTIIVRKNTSYPINMSDGYLVGNTTNSSFNDRWYSDPLNQSTSYYYAAWSYNSTNNLYSNLNSQGSDSTTKLPTIISITPPDGTRNANTPITMYVNASGTSPLNISLYDGHNLDRTNESLGNNASGWSYAIGACDYASGESDIYDSCSGSHYRVYYSAETSAGGYNHVSTAKLTVEIYHPIIISGLYLSYGTHGSTYGIINWYCEYMDYYNQSAGWKTVNHGMPWGQTDYYFNESISVSKIRLWLESDDGDPNVSTYLRISPSLGYVAFVPPTYIKSVSATSNVSTPIAWDAAIVENTLYYPTITINNSIDIIPSIVFNILSESFNYSNVSPINQSEVANTYSHTCSLTINHSRGDLFNVSLLYNNGSGWTLEKTYSNVHNGSYSFEYNDSSEFAHIYYWRVISNDSYTVHNQTFQFSVRATYAPAAPTFNATAINTSYIQITNISRDNRTQSVMLRYNTTGYPATAYDGIQLMNSTNTSYDHRNLQPATMYYYSAWGWNETDKVWGSRGIGQATTYGPLVDFTPKTVNMTTINLTNITRNQYADSVMIRYKTVGFPANITDGTFVMNSTDSSFEHTGLTNTTAYNYSAWGYNASLNFWGTQTNHMGKTAGPQNLSNPSPANGSIDQPRGSSLAITLDDFDDNATQQITFRTNESGTWQDMATYTNLSDGRYSQDGSVFSGQLTWYWWSVNATDGFYWTNATYSFKTKSVYGPTNFKVETPRIKGQLNLTWIKGSDATQTIIVRKTVSYPTNITDGMIVYNSTGEKYNDTGLDPGVLYYYRAWSYNGSKVSSEYDSKTGLTVPLMPTNITATTSDWRNINFTWDMGAGADKTIVVMKQDFYPENISDGLTVFNYTGTYFELGGLKPDDYLNYFTPVYWNNTVGVPPGGGTFNYSADKNESTWWDLNATTVGNFSYRFNISNNATNSTINQTMDPLQRIFSFKFLLKDFYNQTGENWNAEINKADVNNGSWNVFWNGHVNNTNSSPQWWTFEDQTHNDSRNVSEIRFQVWIGYITPNIYEVRIGKLGYAYRFCFWSYASKGGLTQVSLDYNTTTNRTKDTPSYYRQPELVLTTPSNTSINVNPHSTPLGVTATDADGNAMTLYWQLWNATNQSWNTIQTSADLGNGTYYAYHEFAYNTSYKWRIVVMDDADVDDSVYWNWTNDNTSDQYNFTTRDWFNNSGPSALNATLTGERSIHLTWIKGAGADYTTIRMKKWSEPINQSDGTLAYNATEQYCDLYNLTPDTVYFFKAWSWNQTDQLYGTDNETVNISTGTNGVPILTDELPVNGSSSVDRFWPRVNITMNDPEGDLLSWTIYGDNITTTFGTSASNGTYSANRSTPFPLDTMIHWYVDVYDGFNWTNASYNFFTLSNTPLTISNELPVNNSISISAYLENVSVNISDPDSDPINYTIWGDNIITKTQNGVQSGIKDASTSGRLPYNTTIHWYVNATDGTDWINRSYQFTTMQNMAPALSNPNPPNGAVNVSLLLGNVSINISDTNGDPVNISIHGQYLILTNYTGVANGTYSASATSLPQGMTIYWYVNTTDGTVWTNATYSFITANNTIPNQPTCLIPINGTNYTSVYDRVLATNVSDPNNDTLTVSFYWSNGTYLASNTSATSSNVSIFLPNYTTPAWLVHDTIYYWYVNVTDGIDIVTGPLWNFKTSKAWDVDENGRVNAFDVSNLLGVYGTTCVNGSIGADIDGNGRINAFDVSLLLTYYGDRYI